VGGAGHERSAGGDGGFAPARDRDGETL